MADIPLAVLSEKFEEHLDGRRLLAAVFVTFRFDPEFFEQQVLPVFVEMPLSHVEAIRRVQLEDALKEVPHRVAVYYDQNGLEASGGSAKLDVSRIAIAYPTGIFHAKNVFALVEEREADEDGVKAQYLIVAAMSANLTRNGWWESVEVCHIETLEEGDKTRLRTDLLAFLSRLERLAGDKAADGNASIVAIKGFLRSMNQRTARTGDGKLHTHFFDGSTTVVDFLKDAAGTNLSDLYLEIISPYFDKGPESLPLEALIDELKPKEVRVFLPKKDTGEALCSSEFYEWLRAQANVSWGSLPKAVTRGGKSDDIKSRTVHAKVYRFFSLNPKAEYLFVGSTNLTNPAHKRGGNLETGFLVEVESNRRPEWWLETETRKPAIYEPRSEDEGAVSTAGTRLALRYRWDKKTVEAYWDSSQQSPRLGVLRNGVPLFSVESLQPRAWRELDAAASEATAVQLQATSIFQVAGDRPEPVPVLVQEDGMAQRPSLLFDLSPGEILRYWSLLSEAQRAAFLEQHAPEAAMAGAGAELATKYQRIVDHDSFFDRFAGIFVSFGQLERNVRESVASGNDRSAVYRLFGQKYDSLGRLLSRIQEDAGKLSENLIEHYVIALCARQTVTELKKDLTDFFREHADEAQQLGIQLAIVEELRGRVSASGDRKLSEFLPWFEEWFLKRAKPVDRGVEA
jgi:hypothetical protein